ncbi:glycosyltransferase 61 family protein [Rhizorhapis suberifaciens]|uniref:Glycosyltransferase 61 catalytic domain-containing protein n=1 Tax=Rhizorhapis suberifaciens TaxID=13656 RepID=A0A840HS35_9SPHN|nr:glycosyltransferase family 61 protein [Rhizorhapis suberifaciens]MBB4640962.1 hypothetical protein [Rhizorhapis suberifaciens]
MSFPDLESAAAERWTISPGCRRYVHPAKFVPGQLERIRAAEFGSVTDVIRDFRGGYDAIQEETLGFRASEIDLIDGVLYAPRANRSLKPRSRRVPAYSAPKEVTTGALYESWVGNRWFGNWLTDDCLTYRLAERFGRPVTSRSVNAGHMPYYAALLGISPATVNHVHFNELIFFRDSSQNTHKKQRADELRARLTATIPAARHPGVFLLRGETGDCRRLVNEKVIAERLALERGFGVLDPSTASVDEILAHCAGAKVIAGVEGSHLVHGLAVMPPDGILFTIQPPDRVVSVLKIITDRQGQTYAFVVGNGTQNHFTVEWTEIQRTLDLALS